MKSAKVVDKSGRSPLRSDVKIRGLVCIDGRYSYQGRQIKGVRPPRVALGTADYDEAVRLALEMASNQDVRYQPETYAFETGRYLAQRAKLKRSPWTVSNDSSTLHVFGKFIGPETRVSSISTAKVSAWRDHLRKTGFAEATVKTYVLRLHGFFAWLIKEKGLMKNPAAVELPTIKVTRADRFCTQEERDRLINACKRDDLKMMLMLGFHAGLRLNEMLQARVDWVQLWPQGGEIRVQKTSTFLPKGKKARRIPMNALLLAYFKDLKIAGKLSGTYLVRDDVEFQKYGYRWMPRRSFQRILKSADMTWVGFHTLRHTFATQLVIGGCPISSVAQWLGDNIQITYNNYVGYAPIDAHVNAGLTKPLQTET